MEMVLFKQRIKCIVKCKSNTFINLTGIVIATTVFLVISHIALFELSFDQYHTDFRNIYRIQNNRIYQNLNDESAGCPPATGPVLKEEIPEILESTRIKPLPNSIIEIESAGSKKAFYQNHLFYADNSIFNIFNLPVVSGDTIEALTHLNTAIVTKGFGIKYFGKAMVTGEKFRCSNSEGNAEYTITAVIDKIPDNSYLDFDCLLSYSSLISQNNIAAWGWGWNAFNTYVRLKPNSDLKLVNQKLAETVKKYNLSSEDYTRIFKLQPIS